MIDEILDRLDEDYDSNNHHAGIIRAKQSIEKLILEAELRGFDKAYDSHDYENLRAYRSGLKEQLKEKSQHEV